MVQETFLSVDEIVAVHNLRIWGLTTDKTALAAHLAIGKSRFHFSDLCSKVLKEALLLLMFLLEAGNHEQKMFAIKQKMFVLKIALN